MIKLFFYGGNKNYLNISADDLKVIEWYVDASFAVQSDFKSHIGAIITLRKGVMQAFFRKQKLNTRSITEAELVAVSDKSVYILWKVLLIEWQGCNIYKNISFKKTRVQF